MNNLLVPLSILPTCLMIRLFVGFIEQKNCSIYSMNFLSKGCIEVARFYSWYNRCNLIKKVLKIQIPIWTVLLVYQLYLYCW